MLPGFFQTEQFIHMKISARSTLVAKSSSRKKMRLGVLAFLTFAGVVTGNEHGSTEYIMLSVVPTNEAQLSALRDLEESNDFVEFLDRPTELKSISLLVPPALKDQLIHTLQTAGLTVTDNTPHLLKHIRRERSATQGTVMERRGVCRRAQVFPTHDRYYRVSEINDFMASWANCYPQFARMKKLSNRTYEHRDVYYMEIGPQSFHGNRPGGKRVIMIEALAHPREWIAAAATVYTIDMLIRDYASRGPATALTRLLNKFTFVIIPVVNPDGYEYTWNANRMWRNNRRVINSTCTGVNLNRNYDVKFRTTGISKTCGALDYPGETAFSEAETQNVQKLFYSMYHDIHAFLSVHAYSKLLLYPWGYIDDRYSREVPSNVEDLKTVGREMLKELNGYALGTAYDLLEYGASGASEDWALQEKPGIYAYCYELRPQHPSVYGFSLPPDQIRPTGQELKLSLIRLLQKSLEVEQAKLYQWWYGKV